MLPFLRLFLVFLFAAGVIANSAISVAANGDRLAPSTKSGNATMPLVAEAAEEADAPSLWQQFPLNLMTAPKNPADSILPATNFDSRQTNRYRHRSDLHRLNLVFLI